MKKYLKLSYYFFLLFLFIFLTTQVHAQQAQGGLNLTVSPTVIELSSPPGKTIEGKFRLRNNSDGPLTLSLKADKLNANADGTTAPAAARDEDTFVSWLSFESDTVSAASREWTDIAYTITIPEDAAFGYYYAIRITQQATETNENTTVLGEIVIPVLLNVQKDDAKQEMTVLDFKPTNFINETLPVTFVTTVENTGNVHSKPRGNIFIHSAGSQKEIGILEVNDGLGSILPNTKRDFISSWTEGFLVREEVVEDGSVKKDAKGNPVTKLSINWNKLTEFRIGQYTATLLLVYDNGQKDVALEKTATFWVIPYTALGMLFIVLVVIILLIRFGLKSYVSQQIKKSQSK